MELVPIHFWSDSTAALCWIRRNDDWGIFVGNRVKEICHLTNADQWHHVPGHSNPADLPSRGTNPLKLLKLRWWEGPDWLKLNQKRWPNPDPTVDEAAVNQERRKISTLVAKVAPAQNYWFLPTNSYTRNVRVMSLVFRFINAVKTQKRLDSRSFSKEELDQTEHKLFKLVQLETFYSEATVIKGLKFQKDKDGIIRVRTKVTYRDDDEGFRYPVLPNSLASRNAHSKRTCLQFSCRSSVSHGENSRENVDCLR